MYSLRFLLPRETQRPINTDSSRYAARTIQSSKVNIVGSRQLVVGSCTADGLDANRCVRFTGLEFSRGKKIRDFKSLAANTRSEDEEIRLSLVRATYEAGLIGAEAFVKCWNLLKEFSVNMRNVSEKLQVKNKIIIAVHSTYQKDVTLFERLRSVAKILDLQLPLDGAPSAQGKSPNTELSAFPLCLLRR